MVQSLAEQARVKMPSFFSYRVRYALPILLPVLAGVADVGDEAIRHFAGIPGGGEAVATLVRGIRTATRAFQENPLWTPLIPNWNRVESALPAFLDELREAVRLDNEG